MLNRSRGPLEAAYAWALNAVGSLIRPVKRHPAISIGCVFGLILGAVSADRWPSLGPYIVGWGFLSWWYLITFGKLHFSRQAAFSLAFAMIGVASLVIYLDRPSHSLVPDDAKKVNFSIGVIDPSMLAGWSYKNPEIRLDEGGNGWWRGAVMLTATLEKGSKLRPLAFRIQLPQDIELVSPELGGPAACMSEPKADGELICRLIPTRNNRTFELEVNFWWKPDLPRLRIGENYMRLLRVPPEEDHGLAKADKKHEPPILTIFTEAAQTSIVSRNPEPHYSLLNGYAWRLDFPEGDEQHFVDLTLTNRRVRFFADQAPNLLSLAGGLLLGLLAEPLSRQHGGAPGTPNPTP
jgi:hypothetical protein